MTYQQAASHLRLSEGTTRGRLSRARDMLRTRLTKRGIECAGALLAILARPDKALALPSNVIQTSVRAARHFGLVKTAEAAAVSITTTTLVEQAMQTMILAKLKVAGAAGLLIAMLACAVTVLAAAGVSGPNVSKSAIAPVASQTTIDRPASGASTAAS